jgi:glutathione S-transferase
MEPIKVYGWAVSPWMARVLICLEEAGAEYELVPMSRVGGDHRQPEHLTRNVRFSKIRPTCLNLTITFCFALYLVRPVLSSHSWKETERAIPVH